MGARALEITTSAGELSEAEPIPPLRDDLHDLVLSYPEIGEPTVRYLVRQSQILAKTGATTHHWSRKSKESYKRVPSNIFLSNQQVYGLANYV